MIDDRKLALGLAIATTVVLAAMVGVSLATGATQEAHEHFHVPVEYSARLLEHAGALRLVFALDVAFIALYTAFFAALARYLRERPFAVLGLIFIVVTAVLDLVEDHHILAMLDAAQHGVVPSAGEIGFQVAESSTKFSCSYIGLALLGLAIPRTNVRAWLLAGFLVVGTLVTGVIGYAAPPSAQDQLDAGRWIGFAIGFALAIVWLRGERDPVRRSTPPA
jgi:hypothetical protein